MAAHTLIYFGKERISFFFVESIIGAHFIVVYMCNFQLQMSAYQISMEIYLKLVKG